MLCRLARIVADNVEPLLPPQPTIIRLSKINECRQRTGHSAAGLGGIGEARDKSKEYIPSLRDLPGRLELVRLGSRSDDVLALDDGDIGATVGELGDDVVVRVRGVLGLHNDGARPTNGGGMNRENGLQLGLRSVRAGRHVD